MKNTLGDAWYSEPEEPATSVFQMDYYRQKAAQFQEMLTALDQSYWAANYALQNSALDDATAQALLSAIEDYNGRKGTLKATAEAINLGAATINSLGGRFPVLSIPGTLGLPPIIAPAALVAAIGAAAALITWGSSWIQGINDRLRRAQLIESASPAERDALIRAMTESDNSVNVASSSVLASLAPTVKWIAIGLGAFLLYRAYTTTRG
jgi:hypothetical protein